MSSGYKEVLISLKQADGDYFPLFHRGDSDTCNLSLIPAREDQDDAEIHFFYHGASVSAPTHIGTLRFSNLPDAADGEIELRLDAVMGSTGLLTVTLRHAESGRVERLEMALPDESDRASNRSSRPRDWRRSPGRWILGAVFILAAMVLLGTLTWLITDWGREEPLPAPVSVAAVSERIFT